MRTRLGGGARAATAVTVALLVVCAGASTRGSARADGGSSARSLSFPVLATFYYPWFPETWGRPVHSRYRPLGGYYSSDRPATVDRHIRELAYAHVDLAIASWWGNGHHDEDVRIARLLRRTAALRTGLRWSLYYEPEGVGDPTAEQIDSDLAYVERRYASSPVYAHVDGRPVVFVYGQASDGCDMVSRWRRAPAARRFYVVLKVFHGFRSCAEQPDSWHQYAPAEPTDEQRGYSFSVSPGFWKWDEPSPRLPRSLARWRRAVGAMLRSHEPWQLVTTFNEWGEGTAVEPAGPWRSPSGFGRYLDVLHDAAGR